MTIKVKLYTEEKSKFPRSFPAVDGLRFSCSGEGCVTTEKCARWNSVYKGKCRNN
jgi:hypothetical protein